MRPQYITEYCNKLQCSTVGLRHSGQSKHSYAAASTNNTETHTSLAIYINRQDFTIVFITYSYVASYMHMCLDDAVLHLLKQNIPMQ